MCNKKDSLNTKETSAKNSMPDITARKKINAMMQKAVQKAMLAKQQ